MEFTDRHGNKLEIGDTISLTFIDTDTNKVAGIVTGEFVRAQCSLTVEGKHGKISNICDGKDKYYIWSKDKTISDQLDEENLVTDEFPHFLYLEESDCKDIDIVKKGVIIVTREQLAQLVVDAIPKG